MYFTAFPTTTYNNIQVRDISRSASLTKQILRIPTAFHPLELREGQREDLVAKFVYEQESFDWVLWLSNQIVDPYFGWYLTTEQFTNFMIEKYGSIEDGQQRILYWANDWATSETDIPVSYYDALTPNLRKFWGPNYGAENRIISYSRKKLDFTAATNELRKLTVGNTGPFAVNTLCTVFNPDRVGTCEIVSVANSTVMTVKDPLGLWGIGSTIAPRTLFASNTTISNTHVEYAGIDPTEISYYAPVYAWDAAYDENEKNKLIITLDPSYLGKAFLELKSDLNK
jgi:hypothetical protein